MTSHNDVYAAKHASNILHRSFGNFKLKQFKPKNTDKTWLKLVTLDGRDVSYKEARKHLKESELISAGLSFLPGIGCLAITRDDMFYNDTQRLKSFNPIPCGLALYNKCNSPIILTAKRNSVGMREAISNLISSYSSKPSRIFLQPKLSRSPGQYKADVLMKLSRDNRGKHIYFFDNSKTYICKIKTVLSKYPTENRMIHIIHVEYDESGQVISLVGRLLLSIALKCNKFGLLNDELLCETIKHL